MKVFNKDYWVVFLIIDFIGIGIIYRSPEVTAISILWLAIIGLTIIPALIGFYKHIRLSLKKS